VYCKNDVFAIIALYRPNIESLLINVNSLLPQVNGILFYNNGLGEEDRLVIQKRLKQNKLYWDGDGSNIGLAGAMNCGLVWAENNHYRLLLTMDQDTLVFDNTVDKLLDIINYDEDVVSVGPNYKKEKKGIMVKYSNSGICYGYVPYIISSGCLTKTSAIRKVGGFDTGLFIDCVDFDLSLKLRSTSGRIAILAERTMQHSIGDIIAIKLLCNKQIEISEHSPVRSYYISRNHLYMICRYWKAYPSFCLRKSLAYIKYFIEVMLFYHNRKENIKMIVCGFIDAFRGKSGSLKR
jgi:rhamnosyltransferase